MHASKKSLKVSVPEEMFQTEPAQKNLWSELRIKHNILARANHSSVIYNSTLYIYGGYEANLGILGDFHSMPLMISNDSGYEFCEESHNGDYPGTLHRHTAILAGTCMYIFGGKQSIFENSDKLYRYKFDERVWELMIPSDKEENLPPCVESHSAVLYNPNQTDLEIIIFGGFMGGKMGKYSRSIYGYSITNNKWRMIFDGFTHKKKNSNEKKKNAPKKRSSAGMTLIDGSLYIFGGVNSKVKFDDFWKFDLTSKEWTQIESSGDKPLARCGHLCISYKNYIIVFGGIHDIAHEKNDLYCFNQEKSQWTKLDSDFTETLQMPEKLIYKNPESKAAQIKVKNQITPKINPVSNAFPIKMNFLTPKAKNKVSFKGQTKRSKSPPRNKKSSIMISHMDQPKSPKQIREERLKQQFLEKKQQLLAEFEINDEEKRRQLVNSPTTETMKKSINSLNLNFKVGGIHERKDYSFVNKEIGNNNANILKERKPCARDGFSSNIFNNKLVIFGGDRHNMTFKDCYFLDLDKIL